MLNEVVITAAQQLTRIEGDCAFVLKTTEKSRIMNIDKFFMTFPVLVVIRVR